MAVMAKHRTCNAWTHLRIHPDMHPTTDVIAFGILLPFGDTIRPVMFLHTLSHTDWTKAQLVQKCALGAPL